MTIARDLQIELAIYTAGIVRASGEYAAEPNACADWCIRCIHPVGTNRHCENCRHTVRMRQARAEKKETTS